MLLSPQDLLCRWIHPCWHHTVWRSRRLSHHKIHVLGEPGLIRTVRSWRCHCQCCPCKRRRGERSFLWSWRNWERTWRRLVWKIPRTWDLMDILTWSLGTVFVVMREKTCWLSNESLSLFLVLHYPELSDKVCKSGGLYLVGTSNTSPSDSTMKIIFWRMTSIFQGSTLYYDASRCSGEKSA